MARVLIVDDDPSIRRLVRRFLEPEGYDCVEAADGFAALAICEAETPDAVVLDINMPGIDGIEVLRRLRLSAATRRMPILVMTAFLPGTHDAQRGLELGADEYMVKPFPREILLANLKHHLEKDEELAS